MTQKEKEELACEQFNNAPDEGLFPNYSDKDIWVNGFVAGIDYFNKINNNDSRNLPVAPKSN